jgi:hypothetical protein
LAYTPPQLLNSSRRFAARRPSGSVNLANSVNQTDGALTDGADRSQPEVTENPRFTGRRRLERRVHKGRRRVLGGKPD